MSTLYGNNMSLLRAKQHKSATQIELAGLPEDRRVIVSKQGAPTIQYFQDGTWRSLTSAYDPMREARQQLSDVSLEHAKVVFLVGEAALYQLDAVLEAAPKDAKLLLVSSKPSYLRLVLEHRDMSEVLSDDRLIVVASDDLEYIKSALRMVIGADLYDVPTFSLVIHPVEYILQADFVDTIQRTIHWYYTISLTTVNTTQHFEHWWSHNFVVNIAYLLTGTKVTLLEDSWRGKPVVIVGAGPSLNKNIHLLREVQGKALILCVDTAYRILTKAGIKPDLLVTLDGSPMNVKHMENCDFSDVPMFFDEYSHRDITTAHDGPKIVNTSGMFHEHWWNRIYGDAWTTSSIPTGGSVATTAFSLARLMGADPVIMMGVDLSYPEGQLYADGALHAGKTTASQEHRQFFEVEDIFGHTVHTTHDYLVYLRWLELEAQKGDRTYINATQGGALRKGFAVRTMADTIEEFCRSTHPVALWKEKLIHSQNAERFSIVLKNLKRSRREIKAAVVYLRELTSLAEEYHQVLLNGVTAEMPELGAQMARVQARLTQLSFAMDFLDAHSFQAVYNDIKLTVLTERDAENMTCKEQRTQKAAQMLALFTQLRDIAESSIAMHDDGIEVLTNMMLEVEEDLIESAQCL